MTAYLKLLNQATAEALDKMRRGEVPKLDPAFEPEVCYRSQADGHYALGEKPPIEALGGEAPNGGEQWYRNGCPVLSDE